MASSTIVFSFLYIALSALIGWILCRIITTKGEPITATDHGRKWLSNTLFWITVIMLSKYFITLENEELIKYIIVSFVFGLIAFISGMVWHMIKKPFLK